MHPVIRILNFVALAVGLSLGGSGRLGLGAALVGLAFVLAPNRAFSRLGYMLRRMRWLWLSLAVVYLWFTPGAPMFPEWGGWSPTHEGARECVLRVGILVLLASAAHLLLQNTAREQLVAGIHWLAAPLVLMGISRDRFAVRLMLVLETVPRVRPLAEPGSDRAQATDHPFRRLGQRAGELFQSAIQAAESSPAREIHVPDSGAPPWYQWGVPALILLAFASTHLPPFA